MKKQFSMLLAGALLLSGCGTGNQEKKELNLYSWDQMYPQEVLDDFTKETGIKINYSMFDSNETMLTKLESNDGSEYDVVVADDYILEPIIEKDLAQKIDSKALKNYENINPVYQSQYFDPKNEYTVPYGAGVQTIIYNPDLVNIDIQGFDDLLDPSLKDSIGMNNNMLIMMGLSLIADGENVSSEDPKAIEKAGQQLIDMAPNVHAIKDDNLQEDIVSGEISVGLLYTSQNNQALKENPNLKVVYPKEGVGFGTMVQFVPKNAPHSEEAIQFIDYILRPEVAKKCFEQIGNYSTNKAADQLFNKVDKKSLTLPKDLDMDKMQVMKNMSAKAMNQRSELWVEFKNACGY